jgi:hypothetical protein
MPFTAVAEIFSNDRIACKSIACGGGCSSLNLSRRCIEQQANPGPRKGDNGQHGDD